jgi:catechol 2,3-dioxygenase-like lactoylglutathione lyase family enzyme
MPQTNFLLAYVKDVPKSVVLYSKVLGLEPVENSPSFAMFVQPNGVMIGLWARHDVAPAATAPGGMELAFSVKSKAEVEALLRDWTALGLAIAQQPTDMDFGYTFTAVDPDGHRLRVYLPSDMAVHSKDAAAA